jgi:hypothetical protein
MWIGARVGDVERFSAPVLRLGDRLGNSIKKVIKSCILNTKNNNNISLSNFENVEDIFSP